GSATVSWSGQRVAARRWRRSTSAASGTWTWNGRMSVLDGAAATVLDSATAQLLRTSLAAARVKSALAGRSDTPRPGCAAVARCDDAAAALAGPRPGSATHTDPMLSQHACAFERARRWAALGRRLGRGDRRLYAAGAGERAWNAAALGCGRALPPG